MWLTLLTLVTAAHAGSCLPLDDPDGFGPCRLVLGWSWVGDRCELIDGCSTVDEAGNDWAAWILPDPEQCYAACDACPALDPAGFGDCDFVLGTGWTGDRCAEISGCSSVADDGVDYAPWLYREAHACERTCASCPTLDPAGFGLCDFVLGFGPTAEGCVSISGCSAVDAAGVDQSAWLFDTPEACDASCAGCPVLDQTGFGDCERFLGFGWTGSTCEPISGCGTVDVHGLDHAGEFYETVPECLAGCVDGLTLEPPSPGAAGADTALRISGASPGSRLAVVRSSMLGATEVPWCPGTSVELDRLSLLARPRADLDGTALVTGFAPADFLDETTVIQVVDPATCSTSNLIRHTWW